MNDRKPINFLFILKSDKNLVKLEKILTTLIDITLLFFGQF